ncbi:MAG: treX, partial [Rhizobacter sp.]|nr:treX [Rhizobacter sp.]
MQEQRATVGEAHTLGASLTADGVNFAVYSEIAEKIEVCLFDADGSNERRVELPGHTHAVWHGHIAGCRAGDLYGIRVHGPFDPSNGLRCNANKLLLDPYAKAIVGPLTWSTAHYAYDVNSDDKDLSVNDEDSAPFMPKCQVVDDAFDWGDDKPPRVALRDTIYYEAHVKGFTKKHPDIPEEIRGTYAGMGSPKSVEHMKSIGITSVELLPVHAFVQDQRLIEMGLANYWGYNTIGFFAPEPRYAAGNPVTEFKQMVKDLHAAGIEVILDVVYNHTAEGNQLGPTLSFKGIDNPTYYRLSEEDKRYYVDFTGTGNTVNTHHNVALRLIMDSLRYWVTEMHVDGFRFDLASTLGRGHSDFDPRSGFFAAVAQDPLLATVKMVAEPWDVGSTGYQVGGFPTGWAEWNGKYRDALRAFWKGDDGKLAEFSHRLSGSSDLYQHSARGPNDSVNVI